MNFFSKLYALYLKLLVANLQMNYYLLFVSHDKIRNQTDTHNIFNDIDIGTNCQESNDPAKLLDREMIPAFKII